MQLFSDNWYRFADTPVTLRPEIEVSKQVYRGELWYVLFEPISQSFFRLSVPAFRLINSLSLNQTLDQVWHNQLDKMPETVPSQQETIQLLSQMYAGGLLIFSQDVSADKMFAKVQQQKKKEQKARWMNFLFFRIRLLNPDPLLERLSPLFPWLMTRPVAGIWLLTLLVAAEALIGQQEQLVNQGLNILAFDNLILLYLATFVVKSLHELGHGIVCKHYGGAVPHAGVMLLLFAPIPYMDASSTWRFGSKWQRVFVGAAGMITELWLAALAAILWSYSPPGLLNALLYNVMFVASVTTLLFNLNPLMRFDGYYIFSDLLEEPNLGTRSKAMFKQWFEKNIYRVPVTFDEPLSFLLLSYHVLSWCYRLFILTGILLFVSDEYTVVGMGLSVFLISIWWGIPLLKAVAKTLTEAQPARRHKVLKAWGLWFFLPAILLAVIPMPASVLAPGVVQTETRRSVVTTSSGIIRQLYVSSGQEVQAGELLLTLDNPELLLELKTAEAELLRAEAMLKQARAGGDVDSQPIVAHIKNSTDLVADLKRRINELQIKAPVDGIWVDQQIKQKISGWVRQGTELGYLVDISQPIFLAVVAQEQASLLFQQQPEQSALTIRIAGQAEIDLAVSEYQLIPYSQEYLPSESMSLLAGGGIAVDSQDERGVKAVEPFFLIRAKLASGLNQSSLDGVLPGRSGQLNIELNPEPLLSQWWRGVRQFFQNRYQL